VRNSAWALCTRFWVEFQVNGNGCIRYMYTYSSKIVAYLVRELQVGSEASSSQIIATTNMTTESLQIVCISDTHNEDCRNSIPPGDIFIHAGDMTDVGTGPELKAAFDWISSLPHKIKIIVAGSCQIYSFHPALNELI
jgi:hypothetical protein